MAPQVRRVKPPTSSPTPQEIPATAPALASPSGRKSLLPTEKKEPITSLDQALVLLYGEPKVGKTGTAAQFPDNLFLFTEPGGSGISRYEVLIETWEDFKNVVVDLRREARFRTITIDTIDKLYDMCVDYCCTKKDIEDPGDAGFGAGWRAIRMEFEREIERLRNTRRGVVMVSHATDKLFKKRNGLEYNKLVPSASKQATKLAMTLADVTLYFGYYGEQRYMTLCGSDELEGGTRLDKQFWAKDGRRVHSIPAGANAIEGYANLVKAFNNEQATDGRPVTVTGTPDKPGLSDVPPPPKARR